MNRSAKVAAAIAAAGIFSTRAVSAETLTLEDIAPGGSHVFVWEHQDLASGFVLSTSGGHFIDSQARFGYSPHDSGDYYFHNSINSAFQLHQNGAAFSFHGFEAVEIHAAYYAQPHQILVKGFYSGGGDEFIERTFTTSGAVDGLEAFSVGGGWTDLVKVEFLVADGSMSYDNFRVNEPVVVPLPGAAFAGLALVGGLRVSRWLRRPTAAD